MTKYKILILIIIFVGGPIGPYILSQMDLFAKGGNDWIGFLGGYIGAIAGACVAIYVLMETLNSDKEVEIRKEKKEFCDFITEKTSIFAQKYETAIYDAHTYAAFAKSNDKNMKLNSYLKFIESHHSAKAVLYEIESYLLTRREMPLFYSDKLEKLLDSIKIVFASWSEYESNSKALIVDDEESTKDKAKEEFHGLVNLVEKLLSDLRQYVKELIGGEKGAKMKSLKDIYKDGKKIKDKESLVTFYLKTLKGEIAGDRGKLIIYKDECLRKVDFGLPMFWVATIAIMVTGLSTIINMIPWAGTNEVSWGFLVVEVAVIIIILVLYYYAVLWNNKKYTLLMHVINQIETTEELVWKE